MRLIVSFFVCVLISSAALAETVLPCDWQANARNIVEPWEDNSRTFGNGQTRVAMLDTVEPAVGAYYLMVLSPPYSEMGDRQCRLIGVNGIGFSGMDFAALSAGYDPARGLVFTLPVQAPNEDATAFHPYQLEVTLNQSTGAIATRLTRR